MECYKFYQLCKLFKTFISSKEKPYATISSLDYFFKTWTSFIFQQSYEISALKSVIVLQDFCIYDTNIIYNEHD